jgi:hypothetical protein
LADLGFAYGHLIYNPPFDRGSSTRPRSEDFRFIKPKDLIVLATRPPIDDRKHGDKKRMTESCTHLEKQIFAECQKYLEICARSHVQLNESMAAGFERWDMQFQQNKGAQLKSYRSLDNHKRTQTPEGADLSIGFFLHTKAIPEYGCGLVVSFGMGGWETLVWNRIVRTQFPHWLRNPVFIVAEMSVGKFTQKSATLDFADQIKPTILLEHRVR